MNDVTDGISPWVAGGLAGAILTLTTQWFRSWVDRPVLKVFFDGKTPGCLVRTLARLKDQDLASIAGTLQQHYVRLKVKNAGRTAARGVVAYLVALKHAGNEGTTISFDDETLDLNVGLVGGTAVSVLPRGCHRFFDVAHVQESKDVVTHQFDAVATPLRLLDLRFGPGKYEARIHVAAENADPTTILAMWAWDGTIQGLSIEQ